MSAGKRRLKGAKEKAAIKKARLLIHNFLNRTDIIAGAQPNKKACPVRVDDITEFLIAHITGSEMSVPFCTIEGRSWTRRMVPRFGTYTPGVDGKTKFGCFDIDGDIKKGFPVKDAAATAIKISEILRRYEIPHYLEKSRSGNGWHIWILFSEAIDATMVRRLLFKIAPTDIPLLSGGLANPKAGRGIEVFPKSDRIRAEGVGNQVFLPWHGSAKDGGTEFFKVVDGGFSQIEIDEFNHLSVERLQEILLSFDSENQTVDAAPDVGHLFGDSVWKGWRQRALAMLDLNSIYKGQLTGKKHGSGWLECRDPDSPSGDRHPSASVNDKDERFERGRFHSFITGSGMSVFDYLLKCGRAKDFRQACALVAEMTGVQLPAPFKESEDPLSNRNKSFTLMSLGELLKKPEEQLEWLVQDRLVLGGTSIWAGKPKAGKTTLARYLAFCVTRGTEFLGKPVSKGRVFYLALEEKETQVRKHFVDMGATGEEDILIHAAPAPLENPVEQLFELIQKHRPALVIVDTLFRLVRVRDANDYALVNNALEPLNAMARKTGAHILLVHHMGKQEREGADGVLGSTAINGLVDAIVMIRRKKNQRTIQTMQRYGEDLEERILNFDPITRTSSLGLVVEDVTEAEIEGQIRAFIRERGSVTEAEIKESVPGRNEDRSRILRALVQRREVIRSGRGGKGDPYRYSPPPGEFDVPAFDMEQGNNNPTDPKLALEGKRSMNGESE